MENEDGSLIRKVTSSVFKQGDRVAYVSDPLILDRMIQFTKAMNAKAGIVGDSAPYNKLKYAEGTVMLCHYFTDYSAPGRARTRFFYTVVFDDPEVNFMMLAPLQILEEHQLVPVVDLASSLTPDAKSDEKKDVPPPPSQDDDTNAVPA